MSTSKPETKKAAKRERLMVMDTKDNAKPEREESSLAEATSQEWKKMKASPSSDKKKERSRKPMKIPVPSKRKADTGGFRGGRGGASRGGGFFRRGEEGETIRGARIERGGNRGGRGGFE